MRHRYFFIEPTVDAIDAEMDYARPTPAGPTT